VRPFRVVHEAKASHYDYNTTALRERLGEGFFAASSLPSELRLRMTTLLCHPERSERSLNDKLLRLNQTSEVY